MMMMMMMMMKMPAALTGVRARAKSMLDDDISMTYESAKKKKYIKPHHECDVTGISSS